MYLNVARRAVAVGSVAALACLGISRAAVADTATYLCGNQQPIRTVASLPDALSSGDSPIPVTAESVVSGTTPTTFTGEYLGKITDGLSPGKDMILVRLHGGPIDGSDSDVRAGIWEGMSGSPVYDADHKLIGAVAYGLTSSATNIAGVTPIEYMKAIGTKSTATPASRRSVAISRANGSNSTVDKLAGLKLTQLKAVPVASGLSTSALQSAAAKLAAGSHASSATKAFASGVTSASAADSTAYPIVPGGNLFVGYSSGGITLGGLGTVTAVCDHTVWGFGHPMDQTGATQLSLAGASAATIMPDDTGQAASFKQVAKIGAPMGTINQDRADGVKGTLGTLPTKVIWLDSWSKGPLGSSYLHTRLYSQDVASIIVLYQAYGSLSKTTDTAKGWGSIGTAIEYKNSSGKSGTVRTSQYESSYAASSDLMMDSAKAVDAFGYAPEDVAIKAIRIRATVGETLRTRTVGGIQVKSGKTWKTVTRLNAKAGTKVVFRSIVKPAVGSGLKLAYSAESTFTVPKNAVGAIYLGVVGGSEGLDDPSMSDGSDGSTSSSSASDGSDGLTDEPSDWSQFLKDLQSAQHNDRVYPELDYTTRDDDEVTKALPSRAVDAYVDGAADVVVRIKR